MAQSYKVKQGETLWSIAEKALPGTKRQEAVLDLFELNWEPLARRFWLPEGTELKMPAEFDPSANEPFDPSANR